MLQYCFCFTFFVCLFFGCKAYRILAYWSEIEPTPPVLEGEVLTTGPPEKPPSSFEKKILPCPFGIQVLSSRLRGGPTLDKQAHILLVCSFLSKGSVVCQTRCQAVWAPALLAIQLLPSPPLPFLWELIRCVRGRAFWGIEIDWKIDFKKLCQFYLPDFTGKNCPCSWRTGVLGLGERSVRSRQGEQKLLE